MFSFLIFAFAFAGSAAAQNKPSDSGNEQKNGKMQTDRPLKIKHKPFANIGECSGKSQGVTRVKVTFHKSGKVTEAETAVPSGCANFDREAIKAASRIKFEPAIKNGEPVTVVKLIQYKFRK